MKLLIKTLLSSAVALAFTLPATAAEQPWVAKSNLNAKLLLEEKARLAPEQASSLGVDGYDEKISDLSRDLFEDEKRGTQTVVAELKKRLKAEPDAKIRQDLEILIASAEDGLRSSALERKYFLPFIDATGSIYGVVHDMLDPRIPPQRQKALLVRLEKYAGLSKGYRPYTELARERLHERLKANPKLLGPFKGEVEQVLNDGPTLIAGIKSLLEKSQLKGWEKSFAALEQQLTAYHAVLKAEVLPRARADSRLPAEVYADRLRQVGTDVDPEQLISKALVSFAEIRNQMNITGGLIAKEQGLASADYHAVLRELKSKQIAKEAVMPLYADRLGQIEEVIRSQHIVTLPDRKAVIRLASEAENARQPAPHMSPPRLVGNTGEYGEFVLTTGMPPDASGKALRFDDFTHQAGSWTLTAHEGRPGHELQFAKMIEAGVSTARAVFALQQRQRRRLGAVRRGRDATLRAARRPVLRAAAPHAARRPRLPRPDGQPGAHFGGRRQVLPDGRGRPVRGHGDAGGTALHLPRAGPGDLLLLRLPAVDGDAPGGPSGAARQVRPARPSTTSCWRRAWCPPKLLYKAVMEEFVPARLK